MPGPSPCLVTVAASALVFIAPLAVSSVYAQVAAPSAAPQEGATPSHPPRTTEVADPGPQGAFPPPPPSEAARGISGAFSLGPGWLALRDSIGRDGQRAMSMAGRLGVVVAPEWNLFLGVDRASTSRGGATFAQTAGLLGVQRFLFGRLYLGGAVGMAWVRESGVPDGLTDGPGVALSGTVGFEVYRTPAWALVTEITVTGAQYKLEAWEMGGLRAGLVVF